MFCTPFPTDHNNMSKEEFLKVFSKLSFKDKHKPVFLLRGKAYSWYDVYSEFIFKNKNNLLKTAERKKLISELIKDSESF